MDYKKHKSMSHAIAHLLDTPDDNYAWLLAKKSGEIFFPERLTTLFSIKIDRFPLQQLIASSNQREQFELDANIFLWVSRTVQENGSKLILIRKIDNENYSENFSKLASRLIVVGAIITWVAVWFSLVISTSVTKKIKFHQDAEAELNNANQILIEARDIAEKANQTKSEFLSNMSHEIRTPLTSIIGFAESCLDPKQTPKECSTAIKTIIRSGKHLMHIINEILDFSKVEAGKLEVEMVSVKLEEMLTDIEHLISILAEAKGLLFTINYRYPLPEKFISDPLRIKQILINLCSNAIKFTQSGHVNLNVSYAADSSELVFDVIDTGIGISQQQQEKIFTAFEQADSSITRNYGGTGLGLALSKNLIELLDGEISVESTPGKGSHFTVKIKVAEVKSNNFIYEKSKKRSEKLSENVIQVPELEGQILIVEDSKDIQELMKLIIKRTGVDIDIVQNGEEAIRAATESKYDLVLMDIQMPVMDGLTAIKELKQLDYNQPIVAMTANAMKKDRDKYFAEGFTDFISKPVNQNYLYLILTRYLKTKRDTANMDSFITSSLLADEPDLIDLVDKFIIRIPVLKDDINKAFTDNNYDELARIIHQLKGVGGGYGYSMLTELCANIEEQIKIKDSENISTLINDLNLMVDKIVNGKDENHKIINANI